ncbi:hypothetical protein Tco_1112877 [Tanacetum coccineum]|uniref:Uncharacterized protein n=1 Tax=Tanacetum coccineum TaxID=301880 RepID=A0ABQ5IQW7_9ASTR
MFQAHDREQGFLADFKKLNGGPVSFGGFQDIVTQKVLQSGKDLYGLLSSSHRAWPANYVSLWYVLVLGQKSTTGGCQFLGRRLITWQCKKQTIVATSTTEAEYVAAASCCGQVLWIQNQMLDYGFNFMNTKIYIDNESTICIVKNPVYHSKTKHIAIRHHFIRDAYEKKLIQLCLNLNSESWLDGSDGRIHLYLEDMFVKALRRSEESLRRVSDGAEAFLILTLFNLCLDKVTQTYKKPFQSHTCSSNHSNYHSSLQALISLIDDHSLLSKMAALESCPKHNMIAYLEKTEGNIEFHEVIDFLQRSYIFHALTVSEGSTGAVLLISEENLKGARQTRKRLSKKKRVQQELYPKTNWRECIRMIVIKQIESVSKQGRKNAKGDGKSKENAQNEGRSKEMMDEDKKNDEVGLSTEDEVSTAKERLSTDFEKVSTDKPKLSTDDFKVSTDEQMESTDDQVDASEEIFKGTEDKGEGSEEKVESTTEQKESTEEQRVGTEEQSKEEIASQASQTSTLTPTSMTFGDDETIATLLLNMSKAKAVSKEKEKGVELKDVEDTDRPRPTSTRSTLTLKPLPKIDPKDKGKKKIEEENETESEDDDIPQAVKKFKQLESDEELARKVQEEWEAEEEKNKIAEEEAANEALINNIDDVKARIEADRILAEKLQEQEREQFTIEERAKFLHDTIAAQRKFLAQQRSQAIRNKPPTKNQLRNQMMTYIKHVGNYKHADLKSKKFEDIQALYEKIKRFNEDFISTRSAQDERFIKRMNEKGAGLSKSEVIKEETKGEVKIEDKEEESTRKRKLGTRKKMKSRKRRYIQHTSEDDSDKENDDLRLYLTIAQDEDKEVDYEILDRKYPIIDWKTVCLGTKPQFDESKEGEINLNVVTRSNGQQRYFSVLTTVLSIFDREDLNAVFQLVMDKYHDEMPEGFERVLWGDLKVLFKPDEQDEFWSSQHEWKVISWKLHSSSGVHTLMTNEGVVIHMLTEKKYPLKKEIVVQMLNLKLESEEESTMALELIRFIKKVLADLESEEQG